jgi:hypothetical protein
MVWTATQTSSQLILKRETTSNSKIAEGTVVDPSIIGAIGIPGFAIAIDRLISVTLNPLHVQTTFQLHVSWNKLECNII